MTAGLKGRSGILLPKAGRTKRITALLLLVALLFCHGLFGAAHQLAGPPDTPHDPGQGDSHAPMGGDHTGDHYRLGHLDYAAALASVLFGAVIGLLLSGARAWGVSASLQLLRRYSPPLVVFHPARGPTPPLTQVFRL